MTRRRAVAGGALVVAAASVAAWSLAYPQASLSATVIRAVGDCAAIITFGLAVVPMLDVDRYRGELIDRATAPLAVAGAIWLLTELTRLIVVAAQSAGVAVGRLTVPTTVDFALSTTTGRTVLLGIAVAAAVCVATAPRVAAANSIAVAPRVAPNNIAVAGLAAVGVAARALAGHFVASPLGGLAVAVHILAAALWCGALAAIVLTVEHRGQWARVLPRFSQMSLWCVLALLAGGAVGAATRVDSPAELYATGYGRLLSAKMAVTAGLITLGWRNRSIWLPAARSHRATAVMSRSRSLSEVAIMAVALALAAGLAVTG